MKFVWTKKAVEDLTWATLEGEPVAEIAARLGCIVRTAADMQIELGLRKSARHRPWTAKERATVKRLYADTSTKKIAGLLGRTESQVYQEAARGGGQEVRCLPGEPRGLPAASRADAGHDRQPVQERDCAAQQGPAEAGLVSGAHGYNTVQERRAIRPCGGPVEAGGHGDGRSRRVLAREDQGTRGGRPAGLEKGDLAAAAPSRLGRAQRADSVWAQSGLQERRPLEV